MFRGLAISVIAFTIVACTVFILLNPVVLAENVEDFSEGEVFEPVNGTYDFGTFSLNDSGSSNYSVKWVMSGHTIIVDDTGGKVINVVRYSKMVTPKKIYTKNFLDGELEKTSWMVDGVCVHEIEFCRYDNMYSACAKDTSTDTLFYIATQSVNETAGLVNSLRFG